jgi:hypothetical protein
MPFSCTLLWSNWVEDNCKTSYGVLGNPPAGHFATGMATGDAAPALDAAMAALGPKRPRPHKLWQKRFVKILVVGDAGLVCHRPAAICVCVFDCLRVWGGLRDQGRAGVPLTSSCLIVSLSLCLVCCMCEAGETERVERERELRPMVYVKVDKRLWFQVL